jgi:hypothetical protein
VILVVVTEDDDVDVRQIEAEHFQVALHCVVVGARVEEYAAAVDFDQGRETPLTKALIGQHRRQDLDLELRHATTGFGRLRCHRWSGRKSRDQYHGGWKRRSTIATD